MPVVDLEWTEECAYGEPGLDADHRKLYDLYNEIRDSLRAAEEQTAPPADLRALCAGLVTFSRRHFAQEEALMARHGYPEFDLHRTLHRTFLQQIEDIQVFVRDGDDPDAYLSRFLVLSFIGKWLKMHMRVVDRRFAEYMALHVHGRQPAEG